MRRKGLAALTDSWLRAGVRRGGRPPANRRRRPPWSRSAATAAASSRPGSDLDLLLLHADRDVVGRPRRQDLVPGVGHRRAPRPRGAHLRGGPPAGEQRPRRAARPAGRTAGRRRPGARRARCAAACSATGGRRARRRLPELREAWDERGAQAGDLRHDLEPDLKEGRGGLRDVRVAARGRRVLGRRPAAPGRGRRRTRGSPTCATPCSWSPGGASQPAAPAGAGPGGRRPRPGRRRRPAPRGRRVSGAAVTHAAEVTWRRALQATRPQRSPIRARPPAGAAAARARPRRARRRGGAHRAGRPAHRPAARAADWRPRAARAGLPLSPSSVDRLVADAPPLPRAVAGERPGPVRRAARRRASRWCRSGRRWTRPG